MRLLSLRSARFGILPCVVLLLPTMARADWPTSPTVNLPICTAANLQVQAQLTTDMAGGAFIFWQDLRGGVATDIYAQRVLASGVVDPGWPVQGRVVCGATGSQTNPRAVSDGSGGAIVMWQDSRAGTASDIYAHHVLADGSLDPVWPVDGRAVCAASGLQTPSGIVSDFEGGAVLAWRDRRNDSDLFAARVLANGQLDPAWPVDGAAIASGPGAQDLPAILSDGQGGLFAAWRDTRDAPEQDIYAQHLKVNGTIAPGWPAAGVPVCTAAGTQQTTTITTDGSGGVIVGWEDLRLAGNSDIYAQRVRANGTVDPAWPSNGRGVCMAMANQTGARVLGDGAGGAFVAWIDARAGAIPALYAQHVLADGTLDPAWPATDLGFNLAFGNHLSIALLPDGTGGVLAVWDDRRGGTALDVYAHHLLPNGTVDPGWPTNGRGVSTATGTQSYSLAAIPDGSGGVIVTWTDTRTFATTDNDIYAQRVRANGTLGGTVVDVPQSGASPLSLEPLSPTPSRMDRLGLRFTLPREGEVSVELLDVAGRRIAAHDFGALPAGRHSLDWSPGVRVPPGVQLVRLRFGIETRTMRAVTLE